jgi:hypothetical protein
MLFAEKYKECPVGAERPGGTHTVSRTKTNVECIICGRITEWFDVKTMDHVCSEECGAKLLEAERDIADMATRNWINPSNAPVDPGPEPDYTKSHMTRYHTADSGVRKEFESGMRRDTNDSKPRYDLCIPLENPEPCMMQRWAELMQRGADKYGDRNWEKADGPEEYARFRESAIRHFFQWYLGVEDGEDHAAGVFFNIQGTEYVKARMPHK